MYVCPADTVEAPTEVVWSVLTDPASYDTWTDARVDRVEPAGRAHAGQVVRLSAGFLGLRFKIRFDVERADDQQHELELQGQFPFGLSLHERITVRAVDGKSRVQFG